MTSSVPHHTALIDSRPISWSLFTSFISYFMPVVSISAFRYIVILFVWISLRTRQFSALAPFNGVSICAMAISEVSTGGGAFLRTQLCLYLYHRLCMACLWMDVAVSISNLHTEGSAHGKDFSWDVPCSSPGKRGQTGWLKTSIMGKWGLFHAAAYTNRLSCPCPGRAVTVVPRLFICQGKPCLFRS